LRRIVSKNQRSSAAQVTAELIVRLEDSVSIKIVLRELHKFNIASKAAIVEPLLLKVIFRCINGGVTTVRLEHNYKTWTSGNWKRVHVMVR
jgi:Cdc6-like AAA superfamily ATPase